MGLLNELPPTAQRVGDAAAVTVAGLTWADVLPNIAAFMSILWLGVQLGEWVYKKVIAWRSKTTKL